MLLRRYYSGNPAAPWKGDGYEDHVSWKISRNPITGHVPAYYVDLNNEPPGKAGIPLCKDT